MASEGGYKELLDTANSTLTLLERFISSLSDALSNPQTPVVAQPPDPLAVLHTSATLLKAQMTKLSLLLINKPFTPSAIRKAISEVSNTCIPAMMSAVEICRPEVYGKLLHREAKSRVKRVFEELRAVMHVVLEQTREEGGLDRVGAVATGGRDSLTLTGMVWEACDALISMRDAGLVGLVVKEAQELKTLLKDAIDELKEWGRDDGDDEEDEVFDGSENGDELEMMLDSGIKLPKDRPDLRAALDSSLTKLRLMNNLYLMIIQKRLKAITEAKIGSDLDTAPPLAGLAKIDRVMELLNHIPEKTDELAGAFYELDKPRTEELTTEICDIGREAAKETSLTWTGTEDEFTAWSERWVQLINQTSG